MAATTAPSALFPSTQTSGAASPPKKYVMKDGIRQLNPDWQAYAKSRQSAPIVSTMEDHAALCAAAQEAGLGSPPLAPTTDEAIDWMQHPATCGRIGLSPEVALDDLCAVFAKYEIPLGLIHKLRALSEFQCLEFIVDDSYSMRGSRWQEAKERLKKAVELLAHIPTPRIQISFLYRENTLSFERKGETPERFIQIVHAQIDKEFEEKPDGSTPVLRRLEKSFGAADPNALIARYLLCDGVPDGRKREQDQIEALLKARPNAERTPFSFWSCSEIDKDVEWMKEVEEVVDYCSESDDYVSELKEVQKDQGSFFSYTPGVHMICELTAAANPDDLDAMDESIPFTKWTLDALYGVVGTDEEYARYFQGFAEAQRCRPAEDQLDQLKKRQNWQPHYHEFLTAPGHAKKVIPEAKAFSDRLKALAGDHPSR